MDKLSLEQSSSYQIARSNQPRRAMVNIKVNGIPATVLVIEGQPFEMRIGTVDFEIDFEKISE